MTKFLPFRALRYSAGQDLTTVISPPYDVLSPEDRAHYAAKSPNNGVVVDCPLESDGDARYTQAAETISGWQSSGVVVRDAAPTFTIYRMKFTDAQGRARETAGVLGAIEVCDEGTGPVLPHERTTPKAKSDRLDLTRATRMNLSPVWGLSLANGLTSLLTEPGTEVGRVTDEDGVVHIVEIIDDSGRVSEIQHLMASAPTVIADGHHRYAVSRTYRDEQRAANGSKDADYTLAYVAELNEEQLNVAAIHRLYSAIDHDSMRETLRASFDLQEIDAVSESTLSEMESRNAMCLVHPNGSGTLLIEKPGVFAEVRNLDGAKLEHALAQTPHELTYQHGVTEVLHELRNGRGTCAILIKPVTVAEIQRTADEGLLMPPKSTFFTPKLLTGLVFRPLD